MQVGIQFFPDVGPTEKSARDYWQDALQLVGLVDRYDYSHVRTIEHYFNLYGGYSPNPLIFLAAAAQITKRARLVTGAVLPAFNNPLKLAAEIAMLDALCDGRLDVGYARAFLPHEFGQFGVKLDESRARFDEGVEQVRLLLEQDIASSTGQFHSFHNVTSLPRPTQRPRPPFYVAALASKESFERTGTAGYGIMAIPMAGGAMAELIGLYREAWQRAGHPGSGTDRPRPAGTLSAFLGRRRVRLDRRHQLRRLQGLRPGDRRPCSRDIRNAGGKMRCLDRHARAHPRHHRHLPAPGRRLRNRLAAGQLQHRPARRRRRLDAPVR